MQQEPFFFPSKGFFNVRLTLVSFIRKEMLKHLKEKLSEMEGRQTHVGDSYFMS